MAYEVCAELKRRIFKIIQQIGMHGVYPYIGQVTDFQYPDGTSVTFRVPL